MVIIWTRERRKSMKTNNDDLKKTTSAVVDDFFERSWKESWTYIKTVVDVMREPVLILDKDLNIIAANGPFYKTFQVRPEDTEGKSVYNLGNGQWDIPTLRKLLEDILPKNTFFKGFEVTHEFPFIGRKVMILNARQIHHDKKNASEFLPPIILLAIEDITEMMLVAEKISVHTHQLKSELEEKNKKLELNIKKLESELEEIKKNNKI